MVLYVKRVTFCLIVLVVISALALPAISLAQAPGGPAQIVINYPEVTDTGTALQLGTRQAGKSQQIVDQPSHVLSRRAHALQMLHSRFAEARPAILNRRLAEAVDRPQRGAQIMRYRIAEGLQLLIGCGQLIRPRFHPFLQFRVQPAEP